MKAFLALTTAVLLLEPVVIAQTAGPAAAPRAECPLCKVPNRAALLAGTAGKCPPDCAKLCCAGTEVTYLVEGLVCINCSSAVTAALAKLDGVSVDAVCHNTGQARVKYDPAKVNPEKLIAAIVAAGHPVTGEKISLPLPGMNEPRAAALEAALRAWKGVHKVATTIGPNPGITVVFDPSRTTRDEIVALINNHDGQEPSQTLAAPQSAR